MLQGVFSLVDPRSHSPPLFLPLSQIWTFTERISCLGFPWNSLLIQLRDHYRCTGVMGCFRSLEEACAGEVECFSPLQVGGWGRG